MFPKISLAVTAVLATLAVASPTNSPPPAGNQCCSSVQQSDSAGLAGILGLLGVVLDAVVPIGLSCSPITVIGNNCGGTTVTCSGPAYQGGLIAIGCVPITL
ncbi:fungal hydrophobin [Mycena albidolilacea]|uniref:Hydrophobin n=1 Tax=Mycena albidolilacea TaxID=1033008 RepID=A0AAD7AQ14_9AGAR|nr:fungal hydrophobin [Mycena albidolilacea]